MDLERGEKLCLWGCAGHRLIIHSRVAIEGTLLSQAIADARGGSAVGASKLGNHWAMFLRTRLSPRASRKRSRTREHLLSEVGFLEKQVIRDEHSSPHISFIRSLLLDILEIDCG